MKVINPAYQSAPFQVGYFQDNLGEIQEVVYKRVRIANWDEAHGFKGHAFHCDGLDEIPYYVKLLPDDPVRIDHAQKVVPKYLE